MKRSIGMLRQSCAGRPLQLSRQSASSRIPSAHPLNRSFDCKLHTASRRCHPLPSASLRAEHNVNPTATSSSSSSSSKLPPPTLKKPTNRSRQNPSTATSRASSKDSSTNEAKRQSVGDPTPSRQPKITPQNSSHNTSSTRPLSSTVTPSTSSTSASPSLGDDGKKSDPPKTLMDRIRGMWENIKYLFRFYVQGIKQIWTDRRTVADLRNRIAERSLQGGEGVRWIEDAVITQHESDMRKLPLFLSILIILEEILPLVVIYAPSLLPSTCVLPSQSTKMRQKEERIRGLAIQSLAKNEAVRSVVETIVSRQPRQQKMEKEGENKLAASLASLGDDVVRRVAQIFGLSTWGTSGLTARRIEQHLTALHANDSLLQHAFEARGKTSQWSDIVSSDWLWKACSRRGLRAFATEAQDLENNLIAYLHLISQPLSVRDQALLPLALYDGTVQDLSRLQGEAKEEHAKGIRRRAQEVVEEVKEAEKSKEQ